MRGKYRSTKRYALHSSVGLPSIGIFPCVVPLNSVDPASAATERWYYPVIAIDDDPDDLFFITRRINRAGVRNPVMTFNDGEDAVRHFSHLCESRLFDAPACVVFCDIKMPHRNGFEVLRWFRQREQLAPIRFVMLSGSNEMVDHERARELGADQYLVKFPPEKVFADIIRSADLAVKKAFSLPR